MSKRKRGPGFKPEELLSFCHVILAWFIDVPSQQPTTSNRPIFVRKRSAQEKLYEIEKEKYEVALKKVQLYKELNSLGEKANEALNFELQFST